MAKKKTEKGAEAEAQGTAGLDSAAFKEWLAKLDPATAEALAPYGEEADMLAYLAEQSETNEQPGSTFQLLDGRTVVVLEEGLVRLATPEDFGEPPAAATETEPPVAETIVPPGETDASAPETPAAAQQSPSAEEGDFPAAPEPAQLTLDELRAMKTSAGDSVILAQASDGPFVDVVTRGGQRFRFPGDEVRAAALTWSQLTGEPVTEVPALSPGGLQPVAVKDLERRGVVLSKRYEPATGQTFVVTRGGQKLVFPGDEMKAARLTDEQLDGVSRKPAPRTHQDMTIFGKPAAKR